MKSLIKYYCGKGATLKLLEDLIEITKQYFERLRDDVGRDPTFHPDDFIRILNTAENCVYCGIEFNNVVRPVVDHDHITSRIRGAACSFCNLRAQVANFIPMVQSIRSKLIKSVNLIPYSSEKFLSMTIVTNENNKLRFIDTYKFVSEPLDRLVQVLGKNGSNKISNYKISFL